MAFAPLSLGQKGRPAQAHPAEWETARKRHHAILRAATETHEGYVFQIVGDAFCVAFHNTADAIAASVSAQRAIQAEVWGETPIRVRMGLHTGAAEVRDGDYQGYLTLVHVQRVMSSACGGQTLLSNATAALLSGHLPEGVSLRDMGEHRLKGLLNPERLWQVVAPGLPAEFPPFQSLNTIPNNLPIQVTSFVGREREVRSAVGGAGLYLTNLRTLHKCSCSRPCCRKPVGKEQRGDADSRQSRGQRKDGEQA